jgi:hypothetical protein
MHAVDELGLHFQHLASNQSGNWVGSIDQKQSLKRCFVRRNVLIDIFWPQRKRSAA